MRFTTDLSKKNEKGENRINELKNKIDQNKLMAKQKGLENRDMIEKF